MTFVLPPLPYPTNALVPAMSRVTLETHHGKHHKTYVDTLNKLIEGTPHEDQSLVEIVKASARAPDQAKIFNNAGQAWNHTMFWLSMTPSGGKAPGGDVKDAIAASFGDLKAFKASFKEAAVGVFGSGWTWLVGTGNKLEIVTTANAVTPFVEGRHALIACDVWEHAYYLDHKNERAAFLDAFLDKLINWDFAEQRLHQPGEELKPA